MPLKMWRSLFNNRRRFMKPQFISHQEYQDFLIKNLPLHICISDQVLKSNLLKTVLKLWITDLSDITNDLSDTYSNHGPSPRDPSAMLRSYLLLLLLRPTLGITSWVDELKTNPTYAVISGFQPDDTPGVGTFYDFLSRLWNAESANTKSKLMQKRKRKKKKKPKKGQKQQTHKSGIVDRLINRYIRHGATKKDLSTDRLFDYFQSNFLKVSSDLGLLGDPKCFSVAGDGTPFETSRYLRSKSTCDCFSKGITKCSHPRIYSQPDCNSGWDSSREKYYNGYSLYMISACDSFHDLPLYPRLNPASRHDSVSFLFTLRDFLQRNSIYNVDRILLDAAHDAKVIYKILDIENIEPFIDLNPRTKNNYSNESDIKISDNGTPICSMGFDMKPNGFDKAYNRIKWRCPKAKGNTINCESPCSKAKYGRTFHTFPKDDLRLFTKTPRSSKQWKEVYKRRSSVERSNKREKVDYQLEAGRHRSTKMHTIRLYTIMMCQHIDAWYAELHEHYDLADIFS